MVAACGGGGPGGGRGAGLDRRAGASASFRRLLAAGRPRRWRRSQTSVAVEAFSGAVALKPQSMLPYLKRGDTYLHRQEWTAAERDLRQATALDPTAPQPLERLGDVALATGRLHDAAGDYRASLAHRGSRPARARTSWALTRYRQGDTGAAARRRSTRRCRSTARAPTPIT